MVWGLFPTDPLSGEDKYYIFVKGTYKVGRKGCDVIISKDKGVSRVHAEIVVDSMENLDHRSKKSSDINIKVRIRDCSKYGTFVTRDVGSKEKVHECLGKETALKDGDLISFGTGNAVYRFCFVPFVFYVCNIEGSQGFHSVQETVLSIGAVVTKKWTDECTHVIVDQFTPMDDDLIDAIVSRKPFALHKWLEVLTESRISHEIPSCSTHVPTLTFDGASVAVADCRTRENCLKGYTCILESSHVYKFSSRLSLILEVGGARTVSVELLDSSTQDLQDGESNRIVHVVPAGSTIRSYHGVPRLQVNEMDLIRSVISGYLDPSILVSPAIVVSSSCSTDETIVADSDPETETETAISRQPTVSLGGNRSIEHEIKEETSSENIQTKNLMERSKMITESKENDEPGERKSKVDTSKDSSAPSSGNGPNMSFVERNDREVVDGPESGCSEIVYSQNLILRDVNVIKTVISAPDDKVVNFKRFRKTAAPSGNSFASLVPFAKHPYTDSEYERAVVKSADEEKKRKKMEAMAEELFNSEKARRRGVAGSIHTLLSRR